MEPELNLRKYHVIMSQPWNWDATAFIKTITFYYEIKYNSKRVHEFIQVLMQAHKPIWHLLFVHIKNKSPPGLFVKSRTSIKIKSLLSMPIRTCISLPGTWGNSKQVIWYQWNKNYVLLHTFLYKRACPCFLYGVLRCKTIPVKTHVEGKPRTISPNHTC